jgi:small-conductance mechanosensitive channel
MAPFLAAISFFEKPLFSIGEAPITLFSVGKIFFILFFSYFLGKIALRSIKKLGDKYDIINAAKIYTLGRLVFYLILAIGIMTACTTIGIDFTAFAFIAGALSVGIGFGLQSILHNFISGVILLLEKKLRVGDIIELDSKEKGKVEEINVRTTVIRTPENGEIIIPNSEITSKKFINWTLQTPHRKLSIPFQVSIEESKDKVFQVVLEEIKKLTLSIKEPELFLTEIRDNALVFSLQIWVLENSMQNTQITHSYLWAIDTAFKKNQIAMPTFWPEKPPK